MGKASVKVPDGKLVKVQTEGDNVFETVNIRGDFFIEPAEKLYELENSLKGLSRDSSRDELIEKLETVDAELIGFSRKDIAEAVKQSLGDKQ